MIRRRCLFVIFACLQSALTIQATQFYTITDLGAGSARAINSGGEILARDSSGLPFIYLAGQKQYLPQPGAGTFTAAALNDLGQVAGYVNFSGGLNYDLAIYSQGTLNVMSNLSGLSPVAINNAGQIAGDAVFQYQMFLYSNGTVTPISGVLPGESAARGMNAAGAVIGVSSGAGGITQGFMYLNGQVTPIQPPSGASSTVDAINNSGQIVGEDYPSANSGAGEHVFLYNQSGSQDLGLALNLPSEADAAFSINDVGIIVGTAETIPGLQAWIYTPGAGFANLNNQITPNSGWNLFQGIGINDSGEIVGNGLLNGQPHGFLLTPVPEPGSFLSAGFALAGVLGLFASIRQKRNAL